LEIKIKKILSSVLIHNSRFSGSRLLLPKKLRLTKKKEFEKIFRKSEQLTEKIFVLKVRKNEFDYSCFGFIVSLKISKKATARNRVRRQVQESIRANIDGIKKGFDIIISAKPAIRDKSYKEINSIIKSALKRMGLTKI